MIELGVFGCSGRMGKAVIALAARDPEWRLVTAITHAQSDWVDKPLAHMVPGAPELIVTSTFSVAPKVWVDFSVAAATPLILDEALRTKTALLIGTTGLSAAMERSLQEASQHIPILYAANTSIGVNLLLSLVTTAAKTLGISADVAIHETHHRLKKDTPSGTALALGKAVAKARSLEITSTRAGTIAGEHRVLFAWEDELLELRHLALDRSIFAKGALVGARWLIKQSPGLYTMQQALGLPCSI